MKPKWYLNTFILIIAFLGAVLQQFSVPNQEIVLQFEDQEISLGETENAIADVKKLLKNIGSIENNYGDCPLNCLTASSKSKTFYIHCH